MAEQVSRNPVADLGLDPTTITAIERSGGVEAVKDFVTGYRRLVAPALHPDHDSRGGEAFAEISAQCDAIVASPDMLVQAWIKGLSKARKGSRAPKPAETVPELAFRSQSLEALIAGPRTQEAQPFWAPARYIVEYSDSLWSLVDTSSPVGRSSTMLLENTPDGLRSTRLVSAESGHTTNADFYTIEDSWKMAEQYGDLIEVLQSDDRFKNTEDSDNRSGFLVVYADGTNKLFGRLTNELILTDVPVKANGPDPLIDLSRPGFYTLQSALSESEKGKPVRPTFGTNMPSYYIGGEAASMEGTIIGFAGSGFMKRLKELRGSHQKQSFDKQSLPQGRAYRRELPIVISGRLETDILDETYQAYISPSDVRGEKTKKMVVISDGHNAASPGEVVKVMPSEA